MRTTIPFPYGETSATMLFAHKQVTTEAMLDHKNNLLKIPGSKLLWGGEELENHSIPKIYGAIKPTAVFVPLDQILKVEHYELVTKEIFGPFQIITEYKDSQIPMVLNALEKMHAHLTAAVVYNDPLFIQDIVGKLLMELRMLDLEQELRGQHRIIALDLLGIQEEQE